MELDLHGKRKYKLSHDQTPSPTESENGNYYRNLAFSSSSADQGGPNRTSGVKFGTDTYNSEHDDVFVISHADNSVFSNISKEKRIESARTTDELPSKVRTRKICSILTFVILIIGLLAGVAVILYFTVFKDDKASDVSTTTQSTVTTSSPNYVVLESSIKLKNEWSDDLYNPSSDLYKTLSQNYTQEIDNLLQNSNLSQYYVGVTVLDFSPGSIIVHSQISFSPDIFTESLFIDNFDLSNGLEDIIILESSLGKTSLVIDTSEVYVSDKCFNLDYSVCLSFHKTTSFPNFYDYKSYVAAVTYFQNSLQPIIDSQCSSVSTFLLCGLNFPNCNKGKQLLPCRSICIEHNKLCSNRYTPIDCSRLVDSSDPKKCLVLPPETTTTKPTPSVTTTTAQTTSTSTEPMTSPESTTTESTTTTQATKSTTTTQAAESTTASTTTESMTTTRTAESTTASTPTESTTISTSTKSMTTTTESTTSTSTTTQSTTESTNQKPVVSTTSSTTVTKSTSRTKPSMTTTTVSMTTTAGKCEEVKAEECRKLGLTRTTFENIYGQLDQESALASFNTYIKDSCSPNATLFICSMFFPKCVEEGRVEFSCKSLCLATVEECHGSVRVAPNANICVSLLTNFCVAPLPSTTGLPATTTQAPELCEKVHYPECQQFSNYTVFPNLWNGTNHSFAEEAMMTFQPIIATGCSSYALHFFCSASFLQCNNGVPIYPCKSLCNAVMNDCGFSPESLQCSKLNDTKCVSINTTTTVAMTTTSTTAMTTLKQDCSKTNQTTCPDGSCIMTEWLCDGEADCPDNWDEMNCSKCLDDQFTCLDGTCVPANERCNFNPACPDTSDERNCMHLNEAVPGVLMVAYKDYHIPLCNDSWSSSFDYFVCVVLLGNSDVKKASTGEIFPSRTYGHYVMEADENSFTSPIGTLSARSSCLDNKAVSIQCTPKGCGQKLVGSGMIGYIVNGYNALPGAWPWQAAVELQSGEFRKHVCGGVLISEHFVLTATHCVIEYTNIDLYRVVLGATNKKVIGGTAKTYEVERVIKYDDNWYSFKSGDITLLQLKEKLIYTPYIQPICLPTEETVVPSTAICYGTGWGKLSGDENGAFSDDLQELKLKLWKTDKCNSSKSWNGIIAKGYFCAGYESGVRSMCSGDSGGPLVCQDNSNNWYLKGIASYVARFCNMTHHPNVFTDVQSYLGWIKNKTECVFKCGNGKCIFDRGLLCNRVDNCGDNSDEIDQCDVSVNCTFDDQFMCGYGIKGFQQRRQSLDSQTPWSLPSYDHTYGKYPGYYMAGNLPSISEGQLTSPKFSVKGSVCVRFFYNLRGDLNAGLKVRLYPYSGDQKLDGLQVWTSGEGFYTEKWRLGYFDLSIGDYEILFAASDTLKVAVDDVTIHNGLCSQSVCDSQEYKCATDTGKETCISHNSLCNVVKDCHSDEVNCDYNHTNYMCRFEDNVVCGLQQETADHGEWLIVNQTYVKQYVLYGESFPDHSTGTDKGYMLFLLVNLLLPTEYVAMSLEVVLQNKDFCLTFWYRTRTEAMFKVDIESKNEVQNLWNVTDRNTKDWTKAQIQLPKHGDAVIKFTVIRLAQPIHSYYKPHLAMDDVAITSGVCPDFVCPENWSKCGNENYCYPPEEWCDRKLQCSDESDEANCDCTASEFRCGNGRCLPLIQKCDLVTQCLDGSDEGSICDHLRSVSCDFESPYLCGYKVMTNTSNLNEYKWIRNSGPTPSVYTGPSTDHTTGTVIGHYMYAEGNDGNRGDRARMRSINFMSKVNQSLTFYYHMYFEGQFTMSGGLHVAVTEGESNVENVLWFNDSSTGEQWRFGCVDLPANQNLSIIFIANKHPSSIQEADIAVDDLSLKDAVCPDEIPLIETTTSSTTTTTKPAGCQPDQFRCNNGMCIKQSEVCDTVKDCLSGEDELNCP